MPSDSLRPQGHGLFHLNLFKTKNISLSMKVFIEKENKAVEAHSRDGATLLKELEINPSAAILVKNNEIVLEDETFEEGDDIRILSVISGG